MINPVGYAPLGDMDTDIIAGKVVEKVFLNQFCETGDGTIDYDLWIFTDHTYLFITYELCDDSGCDAHPHYHDAMPTDVAYKIGLMSYDDYNRCLEDRKQKEISKDRAQLDALKKKLGEV